MTLEKSTAGLQCLKAGHARGSWSLLHWPTPAPTRHALDFRASHSLFLPLSLLTALHRGCSPSTIALPPLSQNPLNSPCPEPWLKAAPVAWWRGVPPSHKVPAEARRDAFRWPARFLKAISSTFPLGCIPPGDGKAYGLIGCGIPNICSCPQGGPLTNFRPGLKFCDLGDENNSQCDSANRSGFSGLSSPASEAGS